MTNDQMELGSQLKKSKAAFGAFCRAIEQGDEKYPEYKIPLFHYTGVAGFEGIIKSETLWVSDIFSQNKDPFEIRSGLEVCFEELQAAIKKAEFSGTKIFADKFVETLKKHIENAAHFFLFCTSKIIDDPHQWKFFADGGKGVCIEFSDSFAGKFSDTLEDDDGTYSNGHSPVFEVYYDDKELRKKLSTCIDSCVAQLEAGLAAANPDKDEAWQFMKDMTVRLAVECIPYCVEYKPKEFKNENEIRFLRLVRRDRIPRGRKERKDGDKVKYRIEYPFNKDDIKAVWVGPDASNDDLEKIKAMLKEKKWDSVTIKKSIVPIK